MYVKLFGSILDSSIWSQNHATVRVWITLLAMADEHGNVSASVDGLRRRANVSIEECRAALAIFAAPDEDSKTKTDDGRRITTIDGGWHLINYEKYREIRTKKQLNGAARQARYMERQHAGVSVRDDEGDVSADADDKELTVMTTNASASSSVVVSEEKQKIKDPLAAVLADLAFDATVFTPIDWRWVEGMIRAARSPIAVAGVLKEHLDNGIAPAVLSAACKEFAANGAAFNARYFAGFVRDAKGKQGRERANVQAEKFDDREAIERENVAREEAEIARKLSTFERENPDAFARYTQQAEASVGDKWKGMFRAPMVRAKLVKLIDNHEGSGA